MRPKHKTYTIDAADPDGVCQSQTRAGAGALAVNGALASGGIATLAIPRHVSITAVGDESGVAFTVTGFDRYGRALTEIVQGPNAGTTKTTKNFSSVTGVSVDGALAGNVTVGSADSLETAWIPIDHYRLAFDCGATVSPGGSMSWDIETTIGDVFNAEEWDLPLYGAIGNPIGMDAATAIRLKIRDHVTGNITLDIVTRRI